MPGYKLHKFASVLPAEDPVQLYELLLSHWPNADELVIGSETEEGALLGAFDNVGEIEHRMMLLDAQNYLRNDILVKVDRASMSVGLETRAPFLDTRIFEFAWRLPLEWKVLKGVGKRILRHVLYRYVPKELVDRPKRGFGVPLDQWLRCELRDWADALLDPARLNAEGYFKPRLISKKWEEHLSGRRNWAFELWDVLMFQAWLESVCGSSSKRYALTQVG